MSGKLPEGNHTMRTLLIAVVALLVGAAAAAEPQQEQIGKRGFLEDPPVYVVSEPDIPVAGLGAFVPEAGQFLPAFEGVSVESGEWRSNGVAVQQGLFVKQNTIRLGALYGIQSGWAAGVIAPRTRTLVGGDIGGQPSTAVNTGFGDVLLAAKKILWRGVDDQLVTGFGVELPTGDNNAHFDQHNSSTDAYYPTDPGRLPISWQPAPGTTNGLWSLAYARYVGRVSYAGMFVTKAFSRGYADSKIANISLLSACASYGLSRWAAASLGLTYRIQGDDHYPGVDPPILSQPALVATTTHSNILYLDPSLRFLVANKLVVGVDARYPIHRPTNGMSPAVRVDMIFYPSF
jgi:hypothetical protein